MPRANRTTTRLQPATAPHDLLGPAVNRAAVNSVIAYGNIVDFYRSTGLAVPDAPPLPGGGGAPRVLFTVSELYPYVKTGGLGDVAASLPVALKKAGVDIRYFLPGYPAIMENLQRPKELRRFATLFGCSDVRLLLGTLPNGLKAYVVDAPSLYRRPHPYIDAQKRDWADNHLRFGVFCHIAAHLHDYEPNWHPDILHGNDWQCGLIPAYQRFSAVPSPSATLLTIHNVSYQGLFPAMTMHELNLPTAGFAMEGFEYHNQVGFLKAGLYYADHITAVSQSYAHEIATSAKGCGLEGLLRTRSQDLTGILNGIDRTVWNPESDPLIKHHFSIRKFSGRARNKSVFLKEIGLPERPGAPLMAFVGRLTPQKGVDLLLDAITPLLREDISLAIMGCGDPELEQRCRTLAAAHPDRVAFLPYQETLEHRLYAGSDAVIVPSYFEPCGLVQLYAARYGAIPIVRKTGGLADSITNECGFVFNPPTAQALRQTLLQAIALYRQAPRLWQQMQKAAMKEDFSWRKASEKYRAVYDHLLRRLMRQSQHARQML